MKKKVYAGIIASMILCACGNTYNDTTIIGNNNSVGNEKTVNGVDVEVPIDTDINSNNNEQLEENSQNGSSEEIYYESPELNKNEGAVEETENIENEGGKVTPFVSSTPSADAVIHAELVNWSESDRDIFNNNYTGSNTLKLSVYNSILTMGPGSDNITAEIHFPLGANFDEVWWIDFLVMQDMIGNGSYAEVTILSDGEELYPSFTIESDTTEENRYKVNLSGIRDLIIRFECHVVDSGFCGGVIINENIDE